MLFDPILPFDEHGSFAEGSAVAQLASADAAITSMCSTHPTKQGLMVPLLSSFCCVLLLGGMLLSRVLSFLDHIPCFPSCCVVSPVLDTLSSVGELMCVPTL